MVLGAHNVPVASPEILDELMAATQQLLDNKLTAKPESGGKAMYTSGNISFLTKAAK